MRFAIILLLVAGCGPSPLNHTDGMNPGDAAPVADLSPAADLTPYLGEPCTRNADCAGEFTCGATFGPAFAYCTHFCGASLPPHDGGMDCATGYVCEVAVSRNMDAGEVSISICVRQ